MCNSKRSETLGKQGPSSSVQQPAVAVGGATPTTPDITTARKGDALLPTDPSSVPVPSFLVRGVCLSLIVGILAIWSKYTFVDESILTTTEVVHQWTTPLAFTAMYLVSLPLLRMFTQGYLSEHVDTKILLHDSMIVYNVAQVLLNGWMVYRMVDAVLYRGHPIVGASMDVINTGATYAVWVHYCNKYLEFLDTYFMILRGKMDQVSFLHVYHHTSIAWAWWIGLKLYPGGDIYFGALCNSGIHVMMYSYYTLSLLRVHCPWKRYLTQAQLLQFVSVVVYSILSIILHQRPTTGSHNETNSWVRHGAAASVQILEMVSLFVLFMRFYSQAYSDKKSTNRTTLTATVKDLEPTDSEVSTDDSQEQLSLSSTT